MSAVDSENNAAAKASFQPGANARPVLIIATIIALVYGPLLIFDQIWPELPWRLLLPFFLATAVLSASTTRWLLKPNQIIDSARIRVSELLLVILFLRLYTWLITDTFPQGEQVLALLRDPRSIFDGFFIVALVMTLFVSFRSHGLIKLFTQLSLDRSELPVLAVSNRKSEIGSEYTPIFTNRQALIQRYYLEWAIGGAVLIICAAISTFDYTEFTRSGSWTESLRNLSRLGLEAEMLIALLVYFLGGFLLASEGRLAMLNARWTYDGVRIDDQINRNWRRNSFIVLLIVALTAVFVPIGSTVDITGVFQALGWIALAMVGIFVSIIAAIYWIIYTLLLGFRPSEDRRFLSFEEITPEVPQIVGKPNEFIDLIIGGVIWLLIGAAIIAAVVFLIRNRDIRFSRQRIREWWRRFWTWISDLLWRLWNQVDIAAREIRSSIAKIERPTMSIAPPWRFIRLNSLSPRDQIRYFYLTTARRAGDKGLPRGKPETPTEYSQNLKDNWPDLSDDIDGLTSAFLEARYSRSSIEESDAEGAKPFWRRIRQVLRR